jgi:hypothetical protein
MLLAIVAVGEKYVYNTKEHLPKFIKNGWDVRILTDDCNAFPTLKTYEYKNKIFSYIDKLIFPLKLVEEEQAPVLYIDADWLEYVSDILITNFRESEEVLYFNNWPDGKYFSDNHIDYFKPLIDYFKEHRFAYTKLQTTLEYIYYFPYTSKIQNILYDLERIKPIFDYQSIIKKTYFYPNIGNGEGVALSYVLYKNNIPIKQFESKYFLRNAK